MELAAGLSLIRESSGGVLDEVDVDVDMSCPRSSRWLAMIGWMWIKKGVFFFVFGFSSLGRRDDLSV